MPICIECRHPVPTLWTQYSGAGDKSSGHNIRLTVCKNCGRFCDKYVEHDFVVLFIDLVLIKPQVYRHLLHNTLMKEDDSFDSSISRLAILLLLFDVSTVNCLPIHVLSRPLRALYIGIPHEHPFPHVVAVVATGCPRHNPPLSTA
ncbi:Protein arv1 like protein [Verticillium longisporum]|nr:Protein arv1 like protein [Verticillium longisporum]